MDDPLRVCRREPTAGVPSDANRLSQGQGITPVEPALEVLTLQKLSYDARSTIHSPKQIHHVDHIVRANPRNRTHLTLEARVRSWLVSVAIVQHLDSEPALHPHMIRLIEPSHSSRS
jgi:hypothetical protein